MDVIKAPATVTGRVPATPTGAPLPGTPITGLPRPGAPATGTPLPGTPIPTGSPLGPAAAPPILANLLEPLFPPGVDPAGTRAGTGAQGVDRLSIQPLDLAAALQILAAEIRSELTQVTGAAVPSGARPGPGGSATAGVALIQSLAQAPHVLLDMFLKSAPDDMGHVPSWLSVTARLEGALQLGLDRGVATVAAWRDTPTVILDSVRDVRTVVSALLNDESVSPLWLRPEWLGLAPTMRRYWRRRRVARRRRGDVGRRPGNVDDEQLDGML